VFGTGEKIILRLFLTLQTEKYEFIINSYFSLEHCYNRNIYCYLFIGIIIGYLLCCLTHNKSKNKNL